MNTLRVGFLMILCLALGFMAGWRLNQPAISAPQLVSNITPTQKPTDPVAQPIDPAFKISSPAADVATPLAAPSVTERLAMLRWMMSKGLDFNLRVFNDDKITRQFAAIFDLTPPETAQLNEAYRQAKQNIDELTHGHAKLDPTSSAAKLIVNVRAFPVEGGNVYNGLVSVFSTVLGATRSSAFNDISGDFLANSLGSFGLEDTRYEVTRRPADHGWQFYDIKRYNSLPVAPSAAAHPFMGTISGTLQAEGIKKFPALKSFPLPSIDSIPSTK